LKRWNEIRKKGYTPIYWAYQLKAMFKTTMKNRARLGPDRYQIIRYEDLVSDTKREGKKLCSFLNLPFHENLLVPTKGGEAAVSNSMFSEARMVGTVVNQSTSKRWKDVLTEREKAIVVSTLYKESLALGYSHWKENEIRRYRNPFYGGCLPIVYLLNGLKRAIPTAANKRRIHQNRAG
jgi:hypothetical protein